MHRVQISLYPDKIGNLNTIKCFKFIFMSFYLILTQYLLIKEHSWLSHKDQTVMFMYFTSVYFVYFYIFLDISLDNVLLYDLDNVFVHNILINNVVEMSS